MKDSKFPSQDLPYRDKSLQVEERVNDLLQRMTLAEKAGQLFHTMILMGPNGTLSDAVAAFDLDSTEHVVGNKHMTHFNLVGPILDAQETARWHNRLQERALQTRLGIPISLSSDPRNHFTDNVGTGFSAGVFSQWPETLGLAALRSPDLIERFADMARQEYLAVGLRVALHPQVDLATEPRWARISATFGEDAGLSGELVAAYIRGFQGAQLGPQSVSTITKHFPGGGPQKDGEDPHFSYGKEQVYPGNHFEYHLRPFVKAIAAGASQMMPYYGQPLGTEHEEVAFAYNKGVITGLLREKLGFKGIICTDWGLITHVQILGQDMPARAWGCEHLSELQKTLKVLEAGCDQFGGEARPELVCQLVEEGHISESRIDGSVRRLLQEKFILGLFDNPFVEADRANDIAGKKDFCAAGEKAQRQAYTLLTNLKDTLPLHQEQQTNRKVYIEGIGPEVVSKRGLDAVTLDDEPSLAIVRLKAPFDPRPGGFESMFHAGSLEFAASEISRLSQIFEKVPTVVLDIYLDRPAVIPADFISGASAILVNYGSSSDALLDVVFGADGAGPRGKLPFDLPSSMAAVEKSRPDVPYDTENPVFKFGHGLMYGEAA